MVKINLKNWRWFYWPLTEEQFLKWQKAANILLRIKIVSLVLFGFAAYIYFYLNRLDVAIPIFVGGLAAVIFGVHYYKAVKSGRITFEK